MITKVCPKCEMEMRLIPAGISKKTGKAYSTFWSCDSRSGGCGATARAEGEVSQQAPGGGDGSYIGAPAADRLTVIEQKLDEIIGLLKSQ